MAQSEKTIKGREKLLCLDEAVFEAVGLVVRERLEVMNELLTPGKISLCLLIGKTEEKKGREICRWSIDDEHGKNNSGTFNRKNKNEIKYLMPRLSCL